MQPRFLTVYSDCPVTVSPDCSQHCAALGVSSLCDSNLHRWTAWGEDQGLKLLNNKLAFQHESHVWSMASYQEQPDEPVDIQPFSRPQRGVPCMFMMTGSLEGIVDNERFPIGEQWPLSCTEQERAFCLLQERMRRLWSEGRPDSEMRLALISDYAGRLERLGSLQFIYWDGEMLFAYSSIDEEGDPLAYINLQDLMTLPTCSVGLSVQAESPVQGVVIGHRSLLPANAQQITAGATLCFAQGGFKEICEPVDFWSEV